MVSGVFQFDWCFDTVEQGLDIPVRAFVHGVCLVCFRFDWCFDTVEQGLDITVSAFVHGVCLVCFSLTGVLTLESKA